MATLKKWMFRIVGGVVVLVAVASTAVFAVSSRKLNTRYHFRTRQVATKTDSASLARGEHIARLSCYGCHGDSLQGKLFFDIPNVARIVAPNAAEKLASYSDAEFAGYLRYGVRKDGSATYVMPPPGFYHLSGDDVAAALAYLRRQPRAATPALPDNAFRAVGRVGISMGQFPNVVELRDTTVAPVGDDPAYLTTRQGEYLARVICANCHGARLTGDAQTKSPSLAGAAGYSAEEFTTLLRTATPRASTTTLTLMGEAVRGELHLLSDAEIAAVYAYLKALPSGGVAEVK